MPADVSTTFQQALEMHRKGDTVSARLLYSEVLRQDPRHFDSLHLLGLVHVQHGQIEQGAAAIAAAIAIRSDFPEAHYNLGNALISLGRPEQALASLDRAIALKPNDASYHFERGNALKELGRSGEALDSFEAALRLEPRFAEAHNNMGIVLRDEGRLAEALSHYDKAIALRRNYAEAHGNRGNVLKELQRFAEAVASYDTAIRLDPSRAESYNNMGSVLKEMGRIEESLASYDQAIMLKADYAEALNNRGLALSKLDRMDEALRSFEEAIRLKPQAAEFSCNRAFLLRELGRMDEALEAYDRAIAVRPDFAEAFSNRGVLLAEMGRFEEAHASQDRAMELEPSLAMARYNKSLLFLRQHRFKEGFALYHARWQADDASRPGAATAIPQWDGATLDGEIILWAEQGLGDEIFFASMLPLLADRNLRLALSADRRLHPLFARSLPGVTLIDRRDTDASITGTYAGQAPAGDLGHIVGLDAAMLKEKPRSYLRPDPERKRTLRKAHPFLNDHPVCGISWRSGNRALGQNRSVSLADLAPVLAREGVSLVNLQYGAVEQEIAELESRYGSKVHSAPDVDLFHDIDGLVALIDCCDVVVTIDNVTAHLAGALGKPAAVLIPSGKGRHWYWGGESQSLWYPSLTLIYQEPGAGWQRAIAQAADWLAAQRAASGAKPA